MNNIESKLSSTNLDYHKITNILFSNPFLTVGEFEKLLGVARATGNRHIKKMEELNIISSLKIGKNKLIYIKDFVNLLT